MRSDSGAPPGGDPSPQRAWWALPAEDVLRLLKSSDAGLSSAEVEALRARYGFNELLDDQGVSLASVVLRQFTSPLIYILMIAGVVTLVLGAYIDVGIILAVLVINTTIGTLQEYRAERSMEALRRMATARAHAVRDGHEVDIDARELVPGDIVIVETGVKVPADIRLLFSAALEADESLLTGESVTVAKDTHVLDADTPLDGRTNMLVLGSIVTRGRGRGVVAATGASTQLGQIAGSVGATGKAEAPILDRMGHFARVIALVLLAALTATFTLGMALGHDANELFLTLVALMVAAIPESLPIVMTVTLAIGVSRMAQRNVLIRHLPAVETLGSCTVIGSDKTGTLTQNRMTVERILAGDKTFSVEGAGYTVDGRILLDGATADTSDEPALHLLLLAGVLNNEASILETNGDEFEVQGDPTEIALLVAAAKAGIWKETASETYPRWAEVPFDPDVRYAATFHHHQDRQITFVKGAPEEVLRMCGTLSREDLSVDGILATAHEMAAEGLRVLGFAYRDEPRQHEMGDRIPDHQQHLTFLGLQAMMDPPREEVRHAIQACQEAGIRVLMITGDHATTGLAIARQLGIAGDADQVLTGSDLDGLSDEDFDRTVARVPVYARVSPQHKLRIVRALQEQGETVAVTGDGVNDGPALKAANIGVAMGRSGTDVAKEASDMVITDDNFVSIVAAVEEGRIVFDNVRKVTFFLIATGAAVILTVLASVIFDFHLPFLPGQLLWLNLVTNGVQDIFLAFEPGEKDVLNRKARPRNEGIISNLLWERTVVAGLVMALGTVLLFLHEIDSGASLDRARSVALTTMVLFQAFHVGNSRSEHQSAFAKSPFVNPLLFAGTAIALLIHAASLHWSVTQYVLRVEPLDPETWVRMIAVASTVVVAVELHKLIRNPKGYWRVAARS